MNLSFVAFIYLLPHIFISSPLYLSFARCIHRLSPVLLLSFATSPKIKYETQGNWLLAVSPKNQSVWYLCWASEQGGLYFILEKAESSLLSQFFLNFLSFLLNLLSFSSTFSVFLQLSQYCGIFAEQVSRGIVFHLRKGWVQFTTLTEAAIKSWENWFLGLCQSRTFSFL